MAKILLSVFLALFGLTTFAYDVKTYIPKNAFIYLPVVKKEQVRLWSDHPMPEIIPGLIEQESCISLTHSRCWNPESKLDTKREFGQGFGQITKAFKEDGSIRFDALQELKIKHKELSEWTWSNNAIRPDLQIAGLILMNKDNYKALYAIKDPIVRFHFADAGYNGGIGGVNSDRRLCGLKVGCDPQIWFDNVEKTCSKSKKSIYGNRSPCDINREHVDSLFKLRSNKYKHYMK